MSLRDLIDDLRAWVNRAARKRSENHAWDTAANEFVRSTIEKQREFRANKIASLNARRDLIEARRRAARKDGRSA